MGVLVAAASVVLFTATSVVRTVLRYDEQYTFDAPPSLLGALLDSPGYEHYPIPPGGQTLADSVAIMIPTEDCPRDVTAKLRVLPDERRLRLQLYAIEHVCGLREGDSLRFERFFRDSVAIELGRILARVRTRGEGADSGRVH